MANFTFTQLATPGYLGYRSFSNPAINNNGTVVFEAFRVQLGINQTDGGPPQGIFASNGGVQPPAIVADITQGSLFEPGKGPFGVTYNPSISDTGTTAFVGNRLDIDLSTIPPTVRSLISSGVYSVGNEGRKTLAISGQDPYNFAFLNSADINSSGTVAFAAGFIPDPSVDLGGIYTTNNGNITTIADTETTFGGIFKSFRPGVDTVINNSPYSEFTYPSINEPGTVAFTGFLDDGSSGIFSVDNGKLTTIASSNDIFNTFSSAQINNKGQVAFMSQLDAGGRGVFLGNPFGGYTTIADTSSGLFSSFESDPSVNDNGVVAFLAKLADGTLGLFNGSDPVANKVLAVGDDFFGSKVRYLNLHEEGLNNAGQLAFEVELEDGRYTVFRADPVHVPESSGTIALLALAALGVIWRLTKRHVGRTL